MEKRQLIKRKKLNYSIKRNMQVRIFLKIFLIVLVSSVISAFLFYLYARQEIGQTYYQVHVRARTFLDYLWPVILGGVGISVFIGGMIALFLPYCIAGPLYRLERDIKKLGDGDLTLRLKIREGDDIHEFVENLNESIEKLHFKVLKLKKTVEIFKEEIEEEKMPPEVKAFIFAIEEVLSEFKL